ncbi:MAG: chromosome segregation protein SMC [Acidobacteria bacterium]|nr:chromosome segregation protein SMC [Acidobacteriota bacterium]
MFKLQRLEITGFKSFADYTEIIFTGKGITAVVGPNGCGKSNVSDAMSWVLGEQRAKFLRGEEMKDVIFQGTSKRNPSGMAEVVLHLVRDETEYVSEESELDDIDKKLGNIDENAVDIDVIEAEHLEELSAGDETNGELLVIGDDVADDEEAEFETVQAAQVGSVTTVEKKVRSKRRWKPRNFALDFAPGEAVSVARRLYLSGESEYQLNGKNCRLRDIQDLFAGTGLSGSHYAIIEQGKIGQILSSKPSSRRGLIEEAAGISKFRKRQRAAETRLESAKTNLGRISDIVSEIEKQTRTLQRQANKTKRYKILREDLRRLLKQTYAAEGKHLSRKVEELKQKLTDANSIEREILAKVSARDEAFRTATADARRGEENLTDVRAKHTENALNRDRAERERKYQEDQIAELRCRTTVLDSEIKVTQERLRLLANEIERLEKEETKEIAEAGKQQATLLEAEELYRAKIDELRSVERELENERSSHLEHTAAVERLAEIERQFESTLEKLSERIEGLRRENERADEVFNARKKEFAGLEKSIKGEREKLAKLLDEKQVLADHAEEARTRLSAQEKVLKDARELFSRRKHRLETLNELEEKRAIYAPSVQKLFAEQSKIGVEFLGILADKFSVDQKAEKAVENLFGNYLQTVLVRSEKDAQKVVNFLNNNNLGRIPVLIFDPKLESGSVSGKGDSVSQYLGVSKDFEAALAKIFPREMAARVVENVEKINGKKADIFLTLQGDLVIGGKLYISGNANAGEKNSSLLAFKRELRELAKDFEKSKKETGQAEDQFNKIREVLAGNEDKLVDLQAYIVKVERELLSQEIHSKSLAQEIERAERHKKVVADETTQIENEIKQIEKRRIESRQNAKTAGQARDLSEEKIERIGSELLKIRISVEEENAILGGKRTRAEVAAERKRSTQNALSRVRTESSELSSRLERQNLESEENKKRVVEISNLNEELKQKILNAQSELEREDVELREAITHLSEARERSDRLSEELGELNKKSAMARDERAGLEINQAETVTRLRNLDEKCTQDLNVSLQELVETSEIEEDFDLEESRRETESLREKLENFGAINMLALEELSQTEERLEFLTSQQKDIVDGIQAAEDALREIKRRSRQRFRDAFEAINKNFTEFFHQLFGGGMGEMTLIEADDILESGIEIVAQPPGKRLQNMLLLSGGEKAMTAIALVLAIFKYHPSPFCLLDEVDAPLDDANVGRFVESVAAMSENTQFIVITHNKRTMEAARALYGVTMQEAGISKVVSVRFD